MPREELIHKGFCLDPDAIEFTRRAFDLAWIRLTSKLAGQPDIAPVAHDALGKAILHQVATPLGEPDVLAARALRVLERSYQDLESVRLPEYGSAPTAIRLKLRMQKSANKQPAWCGALGMKWMVSAPASVQHVA